MPTARTRVAGRRMVYNLRTQHGRGGRLRSGYSFGSSCYPELYDTRGLLASLGAWRIILAEQLFTKRTRKVSGSCRSPGRTPLSASNLGRTIGRKYLRPRLDCPAMGLCAKATVPDRRCGRLRLADASHFLAHCRFAFPGVPPRASTTRKRRRARRLAKQGVSGWLAPGPPLGRRSTTSGIELRARHCAHHVVDDAARGNGAGRTGYRSGETSADRGDVQTSPQCPNLGFDPAPWRPPTSGIDDQITGARRWARQIQRRRARYDLRPRLALRISTSRRSHDPGALPVDEASQARSTDRRGRYGPPPQRKHPIVSCGNKSSGFTDRGRRDL